MPLTLFATLAALVLSVAYVVSSELLSGRAYTTVVPADVPAEPAEDESRLLAPQAMAEADVAAATPRRGGCLSLRFFRRGNPSDPSRQLIELIASKVGGQAQADYAIRILTTAASATTPILATARSLGRSLARSRRVVLVEFGSAESLDAGRLGLSDLISGQASFADVIHRDRGSRLHMIGAGSNAVEPSGDLDLTLEALSQTYDHVILAAPGDAGNLVKALGPEADFVVLVGTQMAEDAEAGDRLARLGAGEIFVVDAEDDHEVAREAAKTAA